MPLNTRRRTRPITIHVQTKPRISAMSLMQGPRGFLTATADEQAPRTVLSAAVIRRAHRVLGPWATIAQDVATAHNAAWSIVQLERKAAQCVTVNLIPFPCLASVAAAQEWGIADLRGRKRAQIACDTLHTDRRFHSDNREFYCTAAGHFRYTFVQQVSRSG